MLPVTTGVIPFGLVMGTAASNAGLDLLQTMFMNVWVFAGTSQLIAVDLMLKESQILIILLTCWVVNFRFILYSAAFSSVFKNSGFAKKLLLAYCISDHTYAVYFSKESNFKTDKDRTQFYFGSAVCMILFWQISTYCGYVFGNLAPTSLNLDFAIPLCFVSLVIPTIKDKNYIYVAILCTTLSLVLYSLPYNLGLLVTAFSGIFFGSFLIRKKEPN